MMHARAWIVFFFDICMQLAPWKFESIFPSPTHFPWLVPFYFYFIYLNGFLYTQGPRGEERTFCGCPLFLLSSCFIFRPFFFHFLFFFSGVFFVLDPFVHDSTFFVWASLSWEVGWWAACASLRGERKLRGGTYMHEN